MAVSDLFFADGVGVACHAAGAGVLALGPALPGYRAFAGVVPEGAQFGYSVLGVAHAEEWESGTGELDAEGRLVRDPHISSAGAGQAADFSSGYKQVLLLPTADWYAAMSGHGHGIDDVGGLAAALAAKQAASADLSAIAGLASGADKLPYASGPGNWQMATLSAFGRSLVDDGDAAAARGTLGLGSAAVRATGTSGTAVPLLDGANRWSADQRIDARLGIGAAPGAALDVATGSGRVQYLPAVNVAGNRLSSLNGAGSASVPLEISSGGVLFTNSGHAVLGQIDANGTLTLANSAMGEKLRLNGDNSYVAVHNSADVRQGYIQGASGLLINGEAGDGLTLQSYGALRFNAGGAVLRGLISATGELIMGFDSGLGCHNLNRPNAMSEGNPLLFSGGASSIAALYLQAVGDWNVNAAASAINAGRNSVNGRSINAGGTVNASGADYAEYMVKAEGCGPIAKGAACGVDAAGRLVTAWAGAMAFVVKSTDPAYVGGDGWAGDLPERPEDAAAQAQWDAAFEAARARVDRIAFAGQVPLSVSGDFAPGDYAVACAADGGGIEARAVPAAAIDLEQYRRRLGRIWAVRDGQAWIDVQHG